MPFSNRDKAAPPPPLKHWSPLATTQVTNVGNPLPSGPVAPNPSGTQPCTDLPPVPSAIRGKIEKGEFIDFNSLLQENMYPLPNNDPSYTLSFSSDPGSSSQGVLISQTKQKRFTISDLSSWLQAWNVYAMVVINKEPHRR